MLLKDAAKQLVDTIAGQAAQMKQVDKPVQFSLVPFAASVNIGPDKASKSGWTMTASRRSTTRISTGRRCTASNKLVTRSAASFYKKGSAWGSEEDQKVTRFQLYNDLKRTVTQTWNAQQTCTATYSNGSCKTWGRRL